MKVMGKLSPLLIILFIILLTKKARENNTNEIDTTSLAPNLNNYLIVFSQRPKRNYCKHCF